jgi:LysM repeat protein
MITVTVPPGASLWSLAAQYLGNGALWPEIYQANPQLAPYPSLVITGRQLQIPVPPPPAKPPRQSNDDVLAILVAGALLTAVSAAAAYGMIQLDLQYGRVERSIVLDAEQRMGLRGALDAVMTSPPERTEGVGSASSAIARLNLMRRAQFTVAAAKRITADLKQARSQGTPLRAALAAGIQRERKYFGQHLAAIQQRTQAAALVDSKAADFGDLLGWYTIRDKHTSAECLAASGKNFYASAMPLIGYPGGVHPHCRCYPGKPHTGAALLPSARMREAA